MQDPGMPPQPPPLGVGPVAPMAQPPQAIQSLQALGQPQIDPATVEALLSLQGPQNAATRSALKAAALREKSPGDAAQGPGPGGIRVGTGPGGWAVSLGDMVGAVVNKHNQAQADNAASLDAGVADSMRKYAKKQDQAQFDKNQALMAGVPQGTPLTTTLPKATPQDSGGTGLLSL